MADRHTWAGTQDWLDRAACAGEDPEIFFPLSDTLSPGAEARAALALCRRCPVLPACRGWAVEHGEDDGIWGATTAAQRRAIRRAAVDDGTRPTYRRRREPTDNAPDERRPHDDRPGPAQGRTDPVGRGHGLPGPEDERAASSGAARNCTDGRCR
ncbi:WhiB family transcriptional regulator [Streptomyces sp. NPDC020731]|uniref:WhiB family transcriptional regulator n=1 Tax=Streptomyces sp. NPDC020731 TaxID=3365085 RepID=UPI003794FD76